MTVTDTGIEARGAGSMPWRVGIVGGGASGALVAARLLREADTPLEIVVFEPRAELAKGVAYETPDSLHLLNVPACNMSALVEDPTTSVAGRSAAPPISPTRAQYGEYLQALLSESETEAAPGVTMRHARCAVTDIGVGAGPWVRTEDDVQEFDVVVLATGHNEPVVPAVLGGLPATRVVGNPWRPEGLDGIRDGDDVLVIGTGLTFVDVALTILNNAPTARVHAISRCGLLPQAHEDPWRPAHPAPDLPLQDVDPQAVLQYVRSFGEDWRRGIDSLRPMRLRPVAGHGRTDQGVLRGAPGPLLERAPAPHGAGVARAFDRPAVIGAVSLHQRARPTVDVEVDRIGGRRSARRSRSITLWCPSDLPVT